MTALQTASISFVMTLLLVFGPPACAERWPRDDLGGLTYSKACEKAGGFWSGFAGCLKRDAVIEHNELIRLLKEGKR